MSRIVVAVVAPGRTTLSTPGFSAMNSRPSGAHSAAMGCVRPVTTGCSWKSAG
jgi:hypothetical protein